MSGIRRAGMHALVCLGVAWGYSAGFQPAVLGAEVERTTIQVVVTDAETGKPINQAKLTLQFREPGNKFRFKRSQPISFSAKTNPQGNCKFSDVPKVTVRLMVTAEHHESYGKDIEVEKDDQVIEVKLKKPQPLL